jgi:hypothetical protein
MGWQRAKELTPTNDEDVELSALIETPFPTHRLPYQHRIEVLARIAADSVAMNGFTTVALSNVICPDFRKRGHNAFRHSFN